MGVILYHRQIGMLDPRLLPNWSLEHACDLDAGFGFSLAVPWYAVGDMICDLLLYLTYCSWFHTWFHDSDCQISITFIPQAFREKRGDERGDVIRIDLIRVTV